MNILDRFPKTRENLPKAYEDIYEEHYLKNRGGEYKTTSLSQRLEGWMHSMVAADVENENEKETLEIGAGTLNHLAYENKCKTYDIVEPFTALYANSIYKNNIRHFYNDISEVKDTAAYDRITSIAVFEHIVDLPSMIANITLRLKSNGVLRVAIPNEGTVLWRLGTMITGFEFRKKYKLDYQVLMRYEHVNTAQEIEQTLKYFFTECKSRSFGLSKHFAFYRFFECRQPNMERSLKFMQDQA